jgi:GNAT superfamily N-acetyltransferase
VTFRVEQVSRSDTLPLRQRVLRPHQRLDDVGLPGDDRPESGHYAAFDERGEIVGTGSVIREAPSWSPDVYPAWRLRGMATADGLRRHGIGRAVLAACIAHVADHGGGLLWCNARLGAVDFYCHAGFVPHGEPWDEISIGPHVAMSRPVPASRPGR